MNTSINGHCSRTSNKYGTTTSTTISTIITIIDTTRTSDQRNDLRISIRISAGIIAIARISASGTKTIHAHSSSPETTRPRLCWSGIIQRNTSSIEADVSIDRDIATHQPDHRGMGWVVRKRDCPTGNVNRGIFEDYRPFVGVVNAVS